MTPPNKHPDNALWLGFTVPDHLMQSLVQLDPSPPIQTHKFAWSFTRSLNAVFTNISLASTIPIQSYPIGKKIFFSTSNFTVTPFQGIILGFINIHIFKHISRFLMCCFYLPLLIYRKKIKWIFIHGIHSPFVCFGLIMRLFGIKVVLVLTDPAGKIIATDGKGTALLKKIDAIFLSQMITRCNGVIALSETLASRLAPNVPALIFPGILDSSIFKSLDSSVTHELYSPNRSFTIVYAGGLNAAYGVKQLVDAVIKLADTHNIVLKLYGTGDQIEYLSEMQKSSNAIRYEGFIDPTLLYPILCHADLLINPRPAHHEFSKMSFPSKLIEYLSTGRPVLTTRITSIPEKMNEYLYFIENDSVDGIYRAIDECIRIPIADRTMNSKNQKKYLFDNLSEQAIANKISLFLHQL
jgi:glycosyltransferase involved in cell wall biosynthesis